MAAWNDSTTLVQVGEMVASSSLEDGKKLLVQGVKNLEGQYGEARAKSYTLHHFAHDVEQVLALNKQLRAAMRTLDEEDLVEVAQKVRL